MSKEYEFIKECGVFFVSTIKGTKPATRPFGAIMEIDNDLYISTGKTKEVFKQIVYKTPIQIVALKNGTRKWVRVSGTSVIIEDKTLKQKMLDENPILNKRYSGIDDENFALIKIIKKNVEIFE